jgi:2-dehydro-3-deoxy-D-arabinonate dehydratase
MTAGSGTASVGTAGSGPALFRVALSESVRLARGSVDEGPMELLPEELDIDAVLASGDLTGPLTGPAAGPVPAGARVVAPLAGQEVWASGVTFERSRSARNEEAGPVDIYDRVYAAPRPELFCKATPGRVRGPGEPVGIRADSAWNAPEPEVALIADAMGRLVAYSIGNDLSSRSIEGENPLYLPQAKVFTGSCSLGPALVPVAGVPSFDELSVHLKISRAGREIFTDQVSIATMRRGAEELLGWLYQALEFPVGVALLTGTSIVPPPELTLRPGDIVDITVPGLGSLTNPVVEVGLADPRILSEAHA